MPVHRLEESTDEGFELERLSGFGKEDAETIVDRKIQDDE